jgi:hypothetical protein
VEDEQNQANIVRNVHLPVLIFPYLARVLCHDAIAALYVREINRGCETFWNGGIKVWIGDVMKGHHSESMFSREASDQPSLTLRNVSAIGLEIPALQKVK